jgi:diguanylate cyclase (GGDEF)-like protein
MWIRHLQLGTASLRVIVLLWALLLALLVGTDLFVLGLPGPWPSIYPIVAGIIALSASTLVYRRLAVGLREEREAGEEARRDLARLAHADVLTGLGNRARFNEEMHRATLEAENGGRRFALVLFDLNRFKAINDAFGHAAGDAVLVAAAGHIPEALGEDCVAARLGGDEFAVIVYEDGDLDQLCERLARLNQLLSAPVQFEGMEIATGASIGVAVCPDHGQSAARLQTLADRALYRAKSQGGGVCQLDQAMLEASRAEDEMANDIPGAFRRREFQFHYQTKVRLSDGAHVGFEALARWHHPTLGIIYPDTFIPLLERMGLMVELTRHLLTQVARDIADWRAAGLQPGPVAVNLPEQVLSTNLALREIETVLTHYDLPWSALTVELTEDVFIDRALTQIQDNVRELSRRGMRISLDDFGTGYASLTHLRNFPFDEIKIDRSFISEIGSDANCERIASAMIALGRDLGKTVVAEGIETPAQRGWLREHGCNLGQGYLFGRPEPAAEAVSRLVPVGGLISAARRMQQVLPAERPVLRRHG